MLVQRLVTTKFGFSDYKYQDFDLSSKTIVAELNPFYTLADYLDMSLMFMLQTHSANVKTILLDNQSNVINSDDSVNFIPNCDALITNINNLVLGVRSADCVPVLLADSQAHIVAAIHAGRRGCNQNIVIKVVNKMLELSAKLSRLQVFLGPAICGLHYEVDESTFSETIKILPGAKVNSNFYHLDLRLGLVEQLIDLGIPENNIELDNRCTYETLELYSYRKDRTNKRFASLIWLDS